MMRLRYLEANIWELFIGFLVAVTALNYFLSPPPGGVQSPEAYWEILYGVGAAMIFLGLLTISLRIEVAGLSLFAGGATVNALRDVQLSGLDAWVQILILSVFAAAAVVRAYTILRLIRQ